MKQSIISIFLALTLPILANEKHSPELKEYIKAADAGDIEAIRALAQCYLKGIGVPQNIQTGIAYLKKLQELGCKEAELKLKEIEKAMIPLLKDQPPVYHIKALDSANQQIIEELIRINKDKEANVNSMKIKEEVSEELRELFNACGWPANLDSISYLLSHDVASISPGLLIIKKILAPIIVDSFYLSENKELLVAYIPIGSDKDKVDKDGSISGILFILEQKDDKLSYYQLYIYDGIRPHFDKK